MVAAVQISRCVHVQAADSKHSWIVNDIQSISGIEFVHIDIQNPDFCKFVRGKAHGCKNTMYLKTLKLLRSQKTMELALSDGSTALFASQNANQQSYSQRKRQLQSASAATARGDAPEFVDIVMPGFCDSDGAPVESITAKVVADLDNRAKLLVELNPAVLAHVRAAIAVSTLDHVDDATDPKVLGVRWLADRKCWQAVRADADDSGGKKKRSRIFKPQSADCPLALADAKARALEWRQGIGGDDSAPAKGSEGGS